MKYPFVRQDGLKDCGVASLLMILKYYGGGASKEYLRELTHTTKDGVDAYSLLEGAKKLGFSTKGVRGNIEELSSMDLPCIAHVILDNSYQHFVVIYKNDIKKKQLIIADPASTVKKITYQEFKTISSNQFLLLYPDKKITIQNQQSYIWSFLLSFIQENKSRFLLLFLVSLLFTILGIFLSFQFQFLLDYVIQYHSKYNFISFLLLYSFIISMKEWFGLLRNMLLQYVNHILSKELIMDIYHHLLSLPYLYYKNRTTGEVVSRIQDLENIKDFIGKMFVTCFIDSFLLIFSFMILLKVNHELTLYLTLLTILLVIMLITSWEMISTKMRTLREKNAFVNSYLIESISGMETIRGFGLEDYVEHHFSQKLIEYQKTSYQTHKIFIMFQHIRNFIEEYGRFLILAIGAWLVVNNQFVLSSLVTYYFLLSYFLDPIRNLFDIGFSWKETKISMERIDELYQVKEISHDKKLKKEVVEGNIVLKDVYYQYSPKKQLLMGVNMKIQSHDRILIYGKSGSGKSTLAKLLAGIISYDKGEITLDGYPVTEYNEKSLKNNICYLSQNEMLFQDSIYQNIYLDSGKTYQDFLDICSLCMVDEIIENHPLKYHMLLEENGFNISGGERQRILLARAMLKDANIYIFDESLNEIDVDRERKILKNMFDKYPDKTFIIISHRYHNNDLFNRKLEMKDGRCYEIS